MDGYTVLAGALIFFGLFIHQILEEQLCADFSRLDQIFSILLALNVIIYLHLF